MRTASIVMEFTFAKKGLMKYISHLDLLRLFQRAMRRARFPLKFSQGFNPHPKFRIKRALRLGIESEEETAEVVLTESLDSEEFKRRLQEQLPEGITIKKVNVKNFTFTLPTNKD